MKKVLFLIPTLGGGGAEKVLVTLSKGKTLSPVNGKVKIQEMAIGNTKK